MPDNTTKIGIIHTNLSGLNLKALKYLILHQNSIQNSFEFHFLPFLHEDEFVKTLDKEEPINKEKALLLGINFFSEYEEWLEGEAKKYNLVHKPVDSYVVLSTAKFSDSYYLDGKDNWMVIALGNWERSMAPPSIIEFFLTILAECAIGTSCKDNWPNVHHSTMGCAFDFTASLDDARWSVMNGFICSSCKESMLKTDKQELVEDSLLLLKREWLGTPEKPSPISITTKKLGYDLYHTDGVKQTFLESLKSLIEEELVKTTFKIAAGVIGLSLVVWLGLTK